MEQNGTDNIPEEQATEQQLVPFMDDDLAAAMAVGGSIYISLPGCKCSNSMVVIFDKYVKQC